MADDPLTGLKDLLGYEFQRRELLDEALSHPSLDLRRTAGRNYQRLEFLGDRVLGLVIAGALYERDPGAEEGALAVRYNALVRRETVAEVARDIGLAPHIKLGKSEADRGGREKPAILADACEAVIGALYLDGGLEVARRFVLRHWAGAMARSVDTVKDAKTRLQELVQGAANATPTYRVRSRTGPDHAPEFTVEVQVDGADPALGIGGSRREAEQNAAAALLEHLEADA